MQGIEPEMRRIEEPCGALATWNLAAAQAIQP